MISKIKCAAILGVLTLVFAIITSVGYSADGIVNINTAGKEELMTLKYVGEAIAKKIIEYREAHPFAVPEDIMKVKGVGQKIYEANKERICCSG